MRGAAPTLGTGKICYLEIPARDIPRAAAFYRDAFGWQIRERDDGTIAFDDAVGEVSGTWVTERGPSPEPGILIYVMVADLTRALERVRAAGGEIVGKPEVAAPERVAQISDPTGNLMGVYEQPGLAARERQPTPVPEHLSTVTPRLVLPDAEAAIAFYREAFRAELIGEIHRLPDSGQIIHAELRIGSSVVMVTEADGEPAETLLCTYWPDVDEAWERARRAGAEVMYPLADRVYGERGGRLRDPFGQQWMMSMRLEELSADEIAARMHGAS